MILDPLGGETPSFSVDLLKSWTNAKYVSLVMPLLPSTDKYGIPGGLIQSATDLSFNVLKVGILRACVHACVCVYVCVLSWFKVYPF